MRSNYSIDQPIGVSTEAGDLLGFIAEDEARQLLKSQKATMRCNPKRKLRTIVLLASEAEPLRGKSRAIAAAGYTGHEKYTYPEMLPNAGHSIVMLKKYRQESGDFARW